MIDNKMHVQVFRGEQNIGSGDLLPNGSSLAFCPDDKKFELLQMQTDTEKVEDRIPMTFMLDEKKVSGGELYYSGEYICLCPDTSDGAELELLKPDGCAKLFLDSRGTMARLEVTTKGH